MGTSGTVAIDPAIRTKLVEFRSHLEKFEDDGGSSVRTSGRGARRCADSADRRGSDASANAAHEPDTPGDSDASDNRRRLQRRRRAPAQDAPSDVSDEQKDILNHVEAIEVILGANVRAQAQAQSAAGGMVGTTGNASGNTRTTITPSDVTLNQSQLQELRMHLAELRRLLEKK